MDLNQLKNMSRTEAESYLQRAFHIDHFYDDQWTAIHALLQGQRVLLVERTGFGKSLCYQFPAMLLDGVTIVLSPLIALMRDQTNKLNALGITAACINSNNSRENNLRIFKDTIAGKYKIVYITPERQDDPQWQEALIKIKFALLVIDEAHAISTWGHDFRPAFQRIVKYVLGLPQHQPVLATTATATTFVQKDIAAQIQPGQPNPITVIRGPLIRQNFALRVLRVQSEDDKLIWLAQHLPETPGVGLIFVGTKEQTELYATWLKSNGINAASYNGGYDAGSRIQIEKGLMQNQYKCVVTTNALGMGLDKDDIRFIIHTQIPQSPIHYYQEIGRAGRDGRIAHIVLMFNEHRNNICGYEDCKLPYFFIESSCPPPATYQLVIDTLKKQPLKFTQLKELVQLKQNELMIILENLRNQGIVVKHSDSTGSFYEYKQGAPALNVAYLEQIREHKLQDLRSMVKYVFTDKPRMQYLCAYLEDASLVNSCNCDNTDLPPLKLIPSQEWRLKLQRFYTKFNAQKQAEDTPF